MALADPDEATLGDSFSGLRQRRCIVTGEILSEARLVRFVRAPDGSIVPDVEAKLPGRGFWVRSDRATIMLAAAKGHFSRAAKAPSVANPELTALTESRLVDRILAQLGLARRAGELILGFDQVEKALRSPNPPVVVVDAADAAENGRRKLQSAATASGVVPFVLGVLANAELSLALGRENVVHAAVKSGRIAERLIFEAARLDGFRPPRPWVWQGFAGVK